MKHKRKVNVDAVICAAWQLTKAIERKAPSEERMGYLTKLLIESGKVTTKLFLNHLGYKVSGL